MGSRSWNTGGPYSDSVAVVLSAWIVTRQGGRRNISREKLRYIRGRAYNGRKKTHGSANGEARKVSSGNDYHLKKTSEVVADEYGVSEKTIRNDAKFAATLDK